ncbi:hypothetical protein ACFLU5_13930 [Bacteroidota bacterium]
MKRIVYSLLLLYLSGFSETYGQDWFIEIEQGQKIDGFVIGIAGDTINGKITYDYPIVMQNRLIFSDDNNPDEEIQFTPFDIWAYSFNDIYYESVKIKMQTYQGSYLFNRFGILTSKPGAMGIYRFYPERDKLKKNISSLEAETEYDKIKKHPPNDDFSTLYIKKLEEPAVNMGSKSFQKSFVDIIGSMISDNTDLYNKVKNKEYTIQDIHRIVEEYNREYLSRYMQR